MLTALALVDLDAVSEMSATRASIVGNQGGRSLSCQSVRTVIFHAVELRFQS